MAELHNAQEFEVNIPFLAKNSKLIAIKDGSSQLKLISSRPSYHVLTITLFSKKNNRSFSKFFFFEEDQETFDVSLSDYDSFQVSRAGRGLTYSLQAVVS